MIQFRIDITQTAKGCSVEIAGLDIGQTEMEARAANIIKNHLRAAGDEVAKLAKRATIVERKLP